jgi:bifunctional UDP-N-acetylglucosamine pyrophosphorylase/glucosamine-1-phosphate N-acetyltransferase
MKAVILTAGESSRFWPLNYKHKSLTKIMGKPLILHTLETLKQIKIKEIIIVQSKDKAVEKVLAGYKLPNVTIKYVVQQRPEGTGHALWQARNHISGPTFLVIAPQEAVLLDYYKKFLAKVKSDKDLVLVGAQTDRPWDFGIIKMKGRKVLEIVEKPKKGKEPSSTKSVQVYVLPSDFFKYYRKVSTKKHGLIDAINIILKERGGKYIFLKKETAVLKYPWDLFLVKDLIFASKKFKPRISPTAKIGKNVSIKGAVSIGKNAVIGANTTIEGKVYIGNNCKIGANNILRGFVNLENDVLTGAFCEIKNSIIGQGTHFHSGYIGDSIVGENCRFGAGFVTANRRLDRGNIKSTIKQKKVDSGLTYFGVVVGDDTRFGINCGSMPGILIGADCTVGPGTLIMENIEDSSKVYTSYATVKKKKNEKR